MGVSGAPTSAGVIAEIFNECFGIKEATFLVGGAREPFYEPGNLAHIHFREDFVRSALHEVAHWCVAGERRHQLPDYGFTVHCLPVKIARASAGWCRAIAIVN